MSTSPDWLNKISKQTSESGPRTRIALYREGEFCNHYHVPAAPDEVRDYLMQVGWVQLGPVDVEGRARFNWPGCTINLTVEPVTGRNPRRRGEPTGVPG